MLGLIFEGGRHEKRGSGSGTLMISSYESFAEDGVRPVFGFVETFAAIESRLCYEFPTGNGEIRRWFLEVTKRIIGKMNLFYNGERI